MGFVTPFKDRLIDGYIHPKLSFLSRNVVTVSVSYVVYGEGLLKDVIKFRECQIIEVPIKCFKNSTVAITVLSYLPKNSIINELCYFAGSERVCYITNGQDVSGLFPLNYKY